MTCGREGRAADLSVCLSVLDRPLPAVERVGVPGREDCAFPGRPDLEARHPAVQQVSGWDGGTATFLLHAVHGRASPRVRPVGVRATLWAPWGHCAPRGFASGRASPGGSVPNPGVPEHAGSPALPWGGVSLVLRRAGADWGRGVLARGRTFVPEWRRGEAAGCGRWDGGPPFGPSPRRAWGPASVARPAGLSRGPRT